MTPRNTFTVIVAVRSGALEQLARILERFAADAGNNPLCPFGRMGTVHYARWVVLPPAARPDGNDRLPGELVFTTVYDKHLGEHIDELLQQGREGFDLLYATCEGYPASDRRSDADRKKYLLDHSLATSALYGAHDGLVLPRIRLENRLREFVADVADRKRPEWIAGRASGAEIQRQLLQAVGDDKKFGDAPAYAADSSAWSSMRIRNVALLMLGALAVLAIFPIALALFVVWLVILRSHERRDASAAPVRSADHLDQLASAENLFTQSQITILTWVKPGWFRLLTLRFVMLSANLTSRVLLWRKPDFFGIESIHYAQWVIIDNGKRLLFVSNFDGSWESYIGDFVDKAHYILTAVWTNCIGFPKTSFLFFGGAGIEGSFKDLVRDNQLPTQVWYAAYPDLSAPNVNAATEINRGLHDRDRSPDRWLALI
jgi:hypothetical protein